jgi:type IV secretion system protein TrbJ
MKIRFRLATAAAALAIATPAFAIPVFDVSNYSQNVLTAARTLQQIDNQIRQLQNQATSLLNQARNLTALPTSVMGELQRTLSATQQLITRAQGLAFDVTNADQAFRRAYPAQYAATVSRDQLATDARERWSNALEALRTATQVQAQVATSLDTDSGTLADLVSKSQGSVGALQAAQATNQLIAFQAQQTMQAEKLLLANGRAEAMTNAQAVAAHAQALETRRRFMGASGTASYTPAPVSMFH